MALHPCRLGSKRVADGGGRERKRKVGRRSWALTIARHEFTLDPCKWHPLPVAVPSHLWSERKRKKKRSVWRKRAERKREKERESRSAELEINLSTGAFVARVRSHDRARARAAHGRTIAAHGLLHTHTHTRMYTHTDIVVSRACSQGHGDLNYLPPPSCLCISLPSPPLNPSRPAARCALLADRGKERGTCHR